MLTQDDAIFKDWLQAKPRILHIRPLFFRHDLVMLSMARAVHDLKTASQRCLGLVQRVLLNVDPLPIALLRRAFHGESFGVPVHLLEEPAAHAIGRVVRGEAVGDAATAAEVRVVNQKLRKAIENEWGAARIEGCWWQFSLTERSSEEPSAVSLLRISRDRDGALELSGRSWQENGSLSARYWSEAVKERKESPGLFYYWKGERPMDANAPQLDGTGEIRLESADRASGYFTTRANTRPNLNTRTAGVYWRADPEDMSILDGRDDQRRAELIAERLTHWKSIKNA